MNNKTYDSELVIELLNSIPDSEVERTRTKMLIASSIDDAMKEKAISKTELSDTLNISTTEVENWLSGTHNFTIDELLLIKNSLGLSILNLEMTGK